MESKRFVAMYELGIASELGLVFSELGSDVLMRSLCFRCLSSAYGMRKRFRITSNPASGRV
jgi:hypothetical protein